jgi:hypothetical protein
MLATYFKARHVARIVNQKDSCTNDDIFGGLASNFGSEQNPYFQNTKSE